MSRQDESLRRRSSRPEGAHEKNDGGHFHEGAHVAHVICLLFALIPLIVAQLSLYVRWGAVPLAVGITLGWYFSIIKVIEFIFSSRPPGSLELLALVVVALGLCVACHIAILLRIQALGAR
jgi:hypothetical protein